MEHLPQQKINRTNWTETDVEKWPRSYRIGPVEQNFATKEEVVFKC